MDFTFDIRGNLFPQVIIEANLEEVQQAFVEAFEISKTRARVFNNELV